VIVVDTNVVAYLLIEGDKTPAARVVWQRDPAWRLPPLWRSEFLNVLATSVRADVLDAAQARDAWQRASVLLARSEVEPGAEAVLSLAIAHGLSAYDAHFVAVAESLGVTLVTEDRRILAARADVAVSMAAFASAQG
jgi:predicted nucleic acid-binding protein